MANVKFQSQEPEMKGWLLKWTNYIKGYQRRWFVLCNGLLSYYRYQAEMSHTCRGTISLVSAVIHTEDSCHFVISNGGAQTFHLKAGNEIERQRWVTALELAKGRAIRTMEQDDDEDYEMLPSQPEKNELQTVLRVLSSKLEDLITCNDLITKHGAGLQRLLSELEQLESCNDSASRIKAVNERATLFRITTTAMINACNEYLQLAHTQGRKWQRMLQHEHEQRMRLEEMVEQLAKQHSHLEQVAKEAAASSGVIGSSGKNSHSDDDEFYDAEEDAMADFIVSIPGKGHRRTSSGFSLQSEGQGCDNDASTDSEAEPMHHIEEAGVIQRKKKGKNDSEGNRSTFKHDSSSCSSPSAPGTPTLTQEELEKSMVSVGEQKLRRQRIPDRPNYSLNLWSIMKNCIGKDLSKIPMPVNFNEPLSTLQRLTEEYDYADLLDKGARCKDSCEQMAYVAAFVISAYASSCNRTSKPFNPLLGETYECDRRDDHGWRCFSEQVSHHPPMLAQHCHGREWVCWQEFSMSSKFRGKYLQVIPLGITHLEFPKSGFHYTWRKVNTTVHNIIVGKLWIDHHGEMEIINHTTSDSCHLKFLPYSYFSRETPRKVTGVVTDQTGNARWVLQGTWDTKIETSKVIGSHGSVKGKPLLETTTPKVLWRRVLPPPENEKMYNFTLLACQLNEPEEDVAPTDSRRRPDQRLMENGQWDEANDTKVQLEEKQRRARRQKEQEAEAAAAEGRPFEGYEPVWFKKQKDPITGNPIHMYTGKYWECKEQQNWSNCPDIYL